jgi:hypothetical protein
MENKLIHPTMWVTKQAERREVDQLGKREVEPSLGLRKVP